ncbi:SMI1/KNR4 family protein [Chryseobacterium indologenes]|uniref:SMI1/KNR4 family protein n=1 Tax=Chryseobacterium indologenes TaxID=253 RepID=UPI001E31B7F6|nr:SMI1/KNR4 family protein [Chryseobacterium indologenes]MEB4759321.1 SMI1/KNR4 family protein [Chryseobacterium indologenes]
MAIVFGEEEYDNKKIYNMNWFYEKQLKNPQSISEVENIFGIKFPEDYKKIVLEHNGAMPTPNTIDTFREKGKAFGEVLNFNLDADENIISLYEEMKNKLPTDVFPITMDPGGNFLCFDYRENKNNPKVLRWDHEQKFIIQDKELVIEDHENEFDYYHLDFVADSFTEVLTNLYGDVIKEKKLDEVIWEDFLSVEKLKEFDDETLAQVNKRLIKKGLPPIEK